MENGGTTLTPPVQITDRSGMKVHRPASPDFVSRQEAATRLKMSERQIDRKMTAGIFQKVKTSANRPGIRRVDFDAYLAARTATAPPAVIDEVPANFYGLRIQTTWSNETLISLLTTHGYRGLFSAGDERPGFCWVLWHKDMGLEPETFAAELKSLGFVCPKMPIEEKRASLRQVFHLAD